MIRFSIISLLLSNLEGCTSCANIELLISNAMIASIPLRFSCDIFEPNCGRAKANINEDKAVISNKNFTQGRNLETSGISSFNKVGLPIRLNFLR